MDTALMADAVTVANLPAGWAYYAGYLNGSWPNYHAMVAAHPHARVFSITVNHSTRADIADVETGDLTAQSAVLWARDTMHDVPNDELVLYANTSTWPAVAAAFRAAGEPLPLWWAANYSNGPHIPAGAIGIQYADGPYDTSLIIPALWPGTTEETMPLTQADADLVARTLTNSANRDALAGAFAYWMHRALDPTIPLPTGANLPSVVGEVAAVRRLLAAREGAATAALQAVLAAVKNGGGITAEQVTAAAQAGATAALEVLGHDLVDGAAG